MLRAYADMSHSCVEEVVFLDISSWPLMNGDDTWMKGIGRVCPHKLLPFKEPVGPFHYSRVLENGRVMGRTNEAGNKVDDSKISEKIHDL